MKTGEAERYVEYTSASPKSYHRNPLHHCLYRGRGVAVDWADT